MASIADNFEVFGVSLVGTDGTQVTPGRKYHAVLAGKHDLRPQRSRCLSCGGGRTLTELSADGYGRYVKFDTDKTGTFIACIPGVAFVMPMWGYAVILVVCVLVVAAAITVTVVLVRKKKKAKKLTEA